MAMFATSVLLQHEAGDGTTTTSHTLHWIDAGSHDEAIAAAVANAKKLKPHLDVVDVICGNLETGLSQRAAFDGAVAGAAY
jgi:flavin-binding protein dodecin